MEISKLINGKRVIVKKPELLAPAGNLEKLKVAIQYGADAVFVGGKEFSLRSSASNFSISDIEEAVKFANQYGAKIHVTTNIIFHNENINGLDKYLIKLDELGVTAVIAADPYVIKIANELDLNLEVHLSTQMSTTNSFAVNYWASKGVKRVVLAREVGYEDLKIIKEKSMVEIEVFVHGAMCIANSGRCMLSNYYSHRDANRGGCSQSCRWFYDIYSDSHLLNDKNNPFMMSSKDLALINEIPSLIELGIDSFKIEGRMKSIHYIATVISTYRKLIDAYCANPDNFIMNSWYEEELSKAANRAFGTGFYYGKPNNTLQIYKVRDEHPTQDFVLRVLSYDKETKLAKIEERNYFTVGQTVEFFSPKQDNFSQVITELYDEFMNPIDVARHPMQILFLRVDQDVFENDMARKMKGE